jgi:hypothetical protein
MALASVAPNKTSGLLSVSVSGLLGGWEVPTQVRTEPLRSQCCSDVAELRALYSRADGDSRHRNTNGVQTLRSF